MDLSMSPEDLAFQREVRSFIEANFPADIREKVVQGRRLVKDDYVRWQKILHGKGWMAPAWPVEHGGTGWTPFQRYLFEEELSLHLRQQGPEGLLPAAHPLQ